MSVLPVGFGSALGGYQIERSLRFDGAASLTRTFGTPTSRTTWTMNLWFKRSALSTTQYIFHSRDAGNTVSFECLLNTTDNLIVRDYSGSAYNSNYVTTQVFRDPSAWYVLTVRWDTTNATAANRCTIFINGVQITAFSTSSAPSQNLQSQWNVSGYLHSIGSFYNVASYYNGYITETTFVDGYVPTTTTRTVSGTTETILTQLGEFSSSTGVWTPKAWDGTYSGNAAYLKFADNSNNTAATLGKDSSGLGNNWTPNGFSVTAGSGNDSLVDSPTSYGTDTGVGGEVRGNYCTLTPLLFRYAVGVGTITNGNLQATGSSTYFYSTFQMPATGKWYFEGVPTAGSSTPGIGLSDLETARTVFTSVVQYLNDGNKDVNGSQTSYGASYTTNDVIGVAVDCDAGTITFYKNNASQGAITTTVRNQFVFLQTGGSWTWVMNFGQRPFAYTAPSGFKALCTQNLPSVTIGATSTTQANDYFNAVIWTGDGNNPRTVSGVGFQPDFVWAKLRSAAASHNLYDAVRGVGNVLYSDLTVQEANNNVFGYLSAFNSDGFVASAGSTSNAYFNTLNSTYVAWNWKANGAGSTNSNGTAKSSSVTVNSGTDTVTWNSHGMSDGQKIGFFATTMPGGLSAGTLYYVRDAATNTFKVAASSGGAAIDITSNGTSVTCHTTLTSTVSASATSGFSIVTYTGSGANATVEHGLGVAPSMVIVKCRSVTGNQWAVWQSALSGTEYLLLETTNAKATATTIWNSTIPSSTVFSVGTANATNQSTATFVAYCFAPVAGYSAFGSYTGNGSSDGPFVYTGFRPRFVLLKSSSLAGSFWNIVDTARNSYNVINTQLYPNSSAAEGTVSVVDTLSNGFKIRTTNTDFNSNTNTYIYAAFAESPFKYALAR